MKKQIVQEEPMGCGIACVAFLLNKSYKKTNNLFEYPEHSFTRGFYCREIIKVLIKEGLNYSYAKFKPEYRSIMNHRGTIVFIRRDKNYPAGHYLVKGKNGWMNPWINFPNITPAKAGFQKRLPGKAQWIIYSTY